jgi:multicomponent Na+:H+ antiporter subunit D
VSWLLALPVVIPFLTAVFAFLTRQSPLGRWISVAGSSLLLVASIVLMATVLREGVIAGQMGGWPAPFGITLVADLLSAAMVLITAIVISFGLFAFAITLVWRAWTTLGTLQADEMRAAEPESEAS